MSEQTCAFREKRERDRRLRRKRKIIACAIAAVLLAAVVCLTAGSGRRSSIEQAPEATETPVSEETTMHEVPPDWDELMVRAVLDGNERLGADCVELGDLAYTYDDLYLLAKILREEDGADGDGHEWPDLPIIALANVVLNRVKSPLFPNTVREVLYQKGPGDTVQYAPVHTGYWETTEPTERYVRLAQRALNGERVLTEDVIWQSLIPQGEVTVMTYYDEYLGTTTYFCK